MVAAAKRHQVNGCGHMTSVAQAHGASLPYAYAYTAIARAQDDRAQYRSYFVLLLFNEAVS